MKIISARPELLWFRGDDAVRFLNDLISQEISALAPGSVVRSLLLGPRGKLDHLLWVLRGDREVGLIAEEDRGEELAATLGRYRIRVDVDISEPVPGWIVVGGDPDTEGWRKEGSEVVAVLPWRGPPLTFRTSDPADLTPMTDEEWDRIRIESGEPRFGIDVDQGTIPQETGLVAETVDFAKGCYLGQELVARIDSRGRVNRHLRRLQLEAPAAVGSEIVFEGQVVGTLSSASGSAGLGLVRREAGPRSQVVVGGVPAVILE